MIQLMDVFFLFDSITITYIYIYIYLYRYRYIYYDRFYI